MSSAAFTRFFNREAARVRAALLLRRALDGATAGLLLGSLTALALRITGRPEWLDAALASMLVGILLGVLTNATWTDADVALFLDSRLVSHEAITTAIECADRDDEMARAVIAAACSAIDGAPADSVLPAIWRRAHVLVPVLVVAVAGMSLLPQHQPHFAVSVLPRRAPVIAASALDGLRRVEALQTLEAVDSEERERLDALATSARALERKARYGLDSREALDGLEKLREGVTYEQERLTAGRNHAGFEAAAHALAGTRETSDAARALATSDLVAMDREFSNLANSTEAAARTAARDALARAAAAAHKQGAEDVARVLEEQGRLLRRRASADASLRRLAHLLEGASSREVARQLEHLERNPTENSDALAKALADAVDRLTPGERLRLSDALRRSSQGMQSDAEMSAAELDRLLNALSNEQARASLEQQLKDIAAGRPAHSSLRARALAIAAIGVGDAARAVSEGANESGPLGGESQPDAPAVGDSSSGKSDPGGERGSHGGDTPVVMSATLPALVRTTATGGIPEGPAPGSSPPQRPRTAKEGGGAALRAVAPGEIDAVERSDVPKDYREQVSRYFAP